MDVNNAIDISYEQIKQGKSTKIIVQGEFVSPTINTEYGKINAKIEHEEKY